MKKLTLILLLLGMISSFANASDGDYTTTIEKQHIEPSFIPEEHGATSIDGGYSSAFIEKYKADYRYKQKGLQSLTKAKKEVNDELGIKDEAEANKVIEFIKAIPEFVWALLAVFLGAILSWVPLYFQLKHNSKEKEKERVMSLRRDVYLSMVKNIGYMMDYIVSFYQLGVNSPEEFGSSIHQVEIIGTNETIAALNNLNDHIVEAVQELIPKREEILVLDNRLETILGFIEKDISLDLKKDFHCYKEIVDKKIELTYDLAGECQRKAQLAELLITSVIVEIRKEMKTPFDEAKYKSMMEASHKKWEVNTEKYISTMKNAYHEGIQPLLEKYDYLITDDTESDAKEQ